MNAIRRDDLISALPYARRYARALTGSQGRGDHLVAEALQRVLADVPAGREARHLLFRTVTESFDGAGETQADREAGTREAGLSAKQRQLLLLTSLEDVPLDDAAIIVGMAPEAAADALADGRERLRTAAAADVLIIEDEPIIALDIEELVERCGHRVTGVAATEAEAVAIAERDPPGLILADINLGAGGDGSSAVARIMRRHRVPVIFVTAYPERLLTGEAHEPAFVITKPFDPLTLAIATYQAVTGGVQLD